MCVVPIAAIADGAWLDRVPFSYVPKHAAVPIAPQRVSAAELGRCHNARPPASVADRAVTARGWTLVNALQTFGSTTLVEGLSGYDGMCRPLGYQVFLFSGGRFIGTLAPAPMDARTDGVLVEPTLGGENANIGAVFHRYTARDPLCCPSRESFVTYRLRHGVREGVDVTTTPVSR